jgi:DNA topoisomerase-6 subunit B
MRQAQSLVVEVDIKNNRGIVKERAAIPWTKPSGVSVEFLIDGRLQIHGDGGLLTYLQGTSLVNPHLSLRYKLADMDWVDLPRVSTKVPEIPAAVEPHPHTMKLGEFIAHSHLFGRVTLESWLKKGFSRVTDNTIQEFVKNGLDKKLLETSVDKITDTQFKAIYSAIQKTELMAPSTKSVMTIGEEAFSKSIRRLGDIDFFAVVTRKPTICDSKPVVVEVAMARLSSPPKRNEGEDESPVTVLRFANRVPLQFDKAACAMVHSIETVNWRAYGLAQARDSLPLGPYVIAVSLVSPFIKFKNASKETVDASDELVEEMRRALMQVGQRLSRHIRKESREADLEEKLRHIEQFGPILVDGLCRIVGAPDTRRKKAMEGLERLLGRDVNAAKKELKEAVEEARLAAAKGKLQIIDKDAEKAIQDESADKDVIEAVEVEKQIEKRGKHRGTAPKTTPRMEKGKKVAEALVPEAARGAGKATTAKLAKKPAAKAIARKKEKGVEA